MQPVQKETVMKIIGTVIAIALVVIATNLTIMNKTAHAPAPQAKVEERVVEVIGRVDTVFDGLGVDTGFLVRDGNKLSIVHYDQGSLAAQKGYEPKYLVVVKFPGEDKPLINNITVEQFKSGR
jgi:hypothetical protein